MASAPVPGAVTERRAPAPRDLRDWIETLARAGRLGVVRAEVDPRFELAGILTRLDGRQAVFFSHVKGSRFRCVGNTVTGRTDLATALGCEESAVAETFDRASRAPLPYRDVDASDAPVLANRIESDDLLGELPIPIHHELDAGRYLSSGVVMAEDPATGAVNLSINRLQVSGARELRALILPGRLRQILADTEAEQRPLDVVIALGVDPLVTLASQTRLGRDVDELEVAGALRGRPLEVVRSPGNGIPAPARAELLIEARVRPGERAEEGPFGEFPRTYSPSAPGPVLDVTAVHHRDDAVFQTILSGGREHFLVGGLPREADLLRRLRELNPAVGSVRMTEGGSCRFHAVFTITDPDPGHVRNAFMAAFATSPVLKHVVAVDDDVDIFSDEELEWAIATRVQADRDVWIVPEARGSSLDPSAAGKTTAKMGIDATIPAEARAAHARMRVPGARELELEAAVETVGRSPA